MGGITSKHLRTLCIIIAISPLLLGAARSEDCSKAREIYAAGAKLLNYQERAIAFQKAADLCPSFAEARVNLADAFENLAKEAKEDAKKFNELLEKAAAEYQEAIKRNKGLFPAYLGLGDTYRVMGVYSLSGEAYKKALELRPGHPQAVAGLEKIRIINSQDSGGFKKADAIIKHVKESSKNTGLGNLMGFEDHTVVKDRLRFNNILFDEWSAELKRGEAVEQLQEIGKALSSNDLVECDFVVEGHTDNRGGLDRNTKLSQDRADSVKNYLIQSFKIDPERIQTQGFGYSRPRFSNDTSENMLKNRRVELLFVEKSFKGAR